MNTKVTLSNRWLLVITALLFASELYATSAGIGTGGVITGMPWDNGLDRIVQTFSGPIAMGVTAIAIIGAGGMLIFAGQEMNSTVKMIVMVILAGALMGGAVTFTSAFMGTSGATILPALALG